MLPGVTMVHVLEQRAAVGRDHIGYTFLTDDDRHARHLSYRALDCRARAIAAVLQQHLRPRDRVVLLYPSGLDYVSAFFGALYAGAVAVPIYPPRPNRSLDRLEAILEDVDASVALTTAAICETITNPRFTTRRLQSLRWIVSDRIDFRLEQDWRRPTVRPEDLAMLQYTSGSTSRPKGVKITHDNLMHVERAIATAFDHTSESTVVGWLPLHHDMGLIGNILQPLYIGSRCILMSPAAFLRRPIRWLEAISTHRAHTSGAPNFAYDLCVTRVSETDRARLDLSSWKLAFNGAEPVRWSTLQSFSDYFAPCGFRREAFFPCYGLAEATLLVAGPHTRDRPSARAVDVKQLESGRILPAEEISAGSRCQLVDCGTANEGHELAIVDPKTSLRCAAGEVGEIWVRGPTVAAGYWKQRDETASAFRGYLGDCGAGPFMRTGDLGFILDGHLYVTGRRKDLIIIRGRNLYPQDIERTAEQSHPAIRQNGVAAVSLDANGEECLVVLCELTRAADAQAAAAIIEKASRAITEEYEVPVHGVYILKPGALPRTTSGKIRRHAARAAVIADTIPRVAEWKTPSTSRLPENAAAEIDSAGAGDVALALLAEQLGVSPESIDRGAQIASLLDSLGATTYLARLQSRLGIALSLAELFAATSLGEFVDRLLAGQPRPLQPKDRNSTARSLPVNAGALSEGQSALLFLSQLVPHASVNNIACAVRIRGPLDRAVLRRSLDELVRRHGTLRTGFVCRDGGLIPELREGLPDYFAEIAIAGDGKHLLESVHEEARRPFVLERDAMIRVRLARWNADDHLLLIVCHHVVADLWSLEILFDELRELYQASAEGRPASLPALRHSYSDWVEAQATMLASSAGERLSAYWRERLGGELAPLVLPSCRRQTATPDYGSAARKLDCPRGLAAAVSALAARKNVTAYTVYLSAFYLALMRLGGCREVVCGTMAAGRTDARFHDVVGYFANPIALRLRSSPTTTFEALLAEVRDQILDALDHQQYPFARVVREVNVARDPARPNVLSTMFVYQTPQRLLEFAPFILGHTDARIRFGPLQLEAVALPPLDCQYDLTLTLAPVGPDLIATLHYRTGQFDSSSIDRIADLYVDVLTDALCDPGRVIDAIASNREQSREGGGQRHDLRGVPTEHASELAATGATLSQLLDRQASRTPDAVAVVEGDVGITFGELQRRSRRLAARLCRSGVRPECTVALFAKPGIDLIVGMLAIVRSGAAYVPLDHTTTRRRLTLAMEQAAVAAVVTQRSCVDFLPLIDVATLLVDDDQGDARGDFAEAVIAPETLAYVIFTSGSTGEPKGVMVSHANVTGLLRAAGPHFEFDDHDVWTLFHSQAFDFSVWEIWGALTNGSRLVVVPWSVRRDPARLRDLLLRDRVTVLNQTPSAFRNLLWHMGRSTTQKLPDLRLIIFGGEALDCGMLTKWHALNGGEGVSFINMYGITETTVHVTYRRLTEHDRGPDSPIGLPLAGTRLQLLSHGLEPTAADAIGELHVGGAGVSRGYLRRAAATAERFVPDPDPSHPGARLYRSGDYARKDPREGYCYLGRIDEQIKIKGHRVELGEIKAVLAAAPGVRDALVIAPQEPPAQISLPVNASTRRFRKPSDGAGEFGRLVAYIVAEQGVDDATLRQYLMARLPDYMVPADFVFIDALPLTGNGKLDIKALPGPDRSRRSNAHSFVPARTPIERDLVRIWENVLGVDRVGIDDNYFSLGGDSLTSIRVRALAVADGIEFSLQQMLSHQTVRELASVARVGVTDGGRWTATAPFSLVAEQDRAKLPSGLDDAFPLARLQAGILFHCLEYPHAPLYRDVFVYAVEGGLDEHLMALSVQRLAHRHAILRASFHLAEFSEPLVLVHAGVSPQFVAQDLRGFTSSQQDEALRRLIEEEKNRRFEWEIPPLVRVFVHVLSALSFRVILSFHDSILDGWSTALLMTELLEVYRGLTQPGGMSPQAPPKVSFSDFIRLERMVLHSPEQRSFWERALVGTALRRFPDRRTTAAGRPPSIVVKDVEISPALSTALEQLATSASVSVKHVLLAAHAHVLSKMFADHDIVTGLESNGRVETEDGDKVLGLHLNTVPFRVSLHGKTWLELIRHVFKAESDLLPFRRYPFSEVKKMYGGEPIIETVFNYTHFHVFRRVARVGAARLVTGVGYGQTHFPLRAEFNRDPITDRIQLDLEVDLTIIGEAEAQALANEYVTTLRTMTADPARPISAFRVLTDGDAGEARVRGDGGAEVLYDGGIVSALSERAMQCADAVALVCGTQCVSYGRLEALANGLAWRLRGAGAGPEARVAVLLERSIELPLAIVAVLKAGAAYVPLDPSYPAARLRQMVRDSGASVVVTRAGLAAAACGLATVLVEETQAAARPPCGEVEAAHLAYVIYTSGSSGEPKGVAVSHGNLLHTTAARLCYYAEPIEGFVLLPSAAFDSSVAVLFWCLWAGGRLIIAAGGEEREAAALRGLIRRHRVSHWLSVPSLYGAVLEAGGLDGLRAVIVAGEACGRDVVEQHAARVPRATLYNEYGPTEGTVWSTVARLWPAAADEGAVPIGRPIAGVRTYLLDRHLQLTPWSVSGELCLAGAGVARGYLGRAGLTAERFVPDPHGGAGERLYRSGDVARYRADGQLEFHGRADQQLKIRGHRIEPAEVESALRRHGAVAEAAVAAVAPRPGRAPELVAFVVAAGAAAPDGAQLRQHLAALLPDAMIPARYQVVAALPRSPNGKLDRNALLSLAPPPDNLRPYRAPRTPLEHKLAAIWAELLNRDPIGIDDNFFEIGGHSILAISLASKIETVVGYALPLSAIMEAPSIARLAAALDKLQDGLATAGFQLPPFEVSRPQDRFQPFPLTAIQEAYWIGRAEAFELGRVATCSYSEYDNPDLDIERFCRGVQRLVDRHDMLRAVLLPDGRQQVLANVPSYDVKVIDLRDCPAEEVDRTLAETREFGSMRVFDPYTWPLFEIRIHRLRDNVRIHLSLDLLICDAYSSRVLTRELSELYHNPDADLPPLEVTFRDYVLAEQALRDTAAYAQSREYWLHRLPDLPMAPNLPLVKSASQVAQPVFKRRSASLPQDLWLTLKSRGAEAAITPTGILCAAFSEVLRTWSWNTSFTINLTTYARLPVHPQVDDIVGDFTATTLLAVQRSEGSFVDRARRLQERLWTDLQHRFFTGVEALRQLRRIHGAASRAYMPVVFTSTLGRGSIEEQTSARAWLGEHVYSTGQTPQVAIDHQISEMYGDLVFWWDCVDELFPAEMLDDMFASYSALLHRLATDDGAWREPAAVLIPPRQLTQQRQTNATHGPSSEQTLHGLWERQIDAVADQPAVITPTRTLTHAQLLGMTDALAHHLRGLGARPGTLIAVVMDKGWEQVAAIVAILRAGAAYVPIDASLPAQRIRLLLDCTRASIALTQSWRDTALEWPHAVQRVVVDDPRWSVAPHGLPAAASGPDDLAYVIFTSGSTGEPKGVMINHRSAVNTITDINNRFAVSATDRVLSLSSLSFDLSVYDVFGMLAAGGAVVLPARHDGRAPDAWSELIATHGVTIWNSVPTLLEMLLAARGARHEIIRLVLLSGDWIPVGLPSRARTRLPRASLYSLGGATEASIWSIIYQIKDVDPAWKSIPYGMPMQNQTFHVLDEDLKPRPTLVAGELYIGGAGLALGYWGDDQLTAARFIIHPTTGERLYRTGDLGRYLADGNIEFLGRTDAQIKLHGHRIEPAEIEAKLLKHPQVAAAVVVPTGQAAVDRRLVCYVVPNRDSPPSSNGAPRADGARTNAADDRSTEVALLRFRLSEPGLRQHATGARVVPLGGREALSDDLHGVNRSCRSFLDRPIALESFGAWLGCLRQVKSESSLFPRYAYPSAGGLYPVQAYVVVKANRIEGLAEGLYYYHPRDNTLCLIAPGASVGSDLYDPINRDVVDEAAFSIFLVAQRRAIEPAYGAFARDLCLLEAGYMGQLLLSAGPKHRIGLCPMGGLKFEGVRGLFSLDDGHELMHCLVGGLPDPGALTDAAGVPRRRRGLGSAESNLAADDLVNELRNYLRSAVPRHMVPAVLTLTDALPLTANGKVNRQELSERAAAVSDPIRPRMPARSRTEQEIAGLWRQALGIDEIGIEENFFDLGGNSLHIVRMHNQLRERYGDDLPLVALFEYPTIAELSMFIADISERKVKARQAAPVAGQAGSEARASLAFAAGKRREARLSQRR